MTDYCTVEELRQFQSFPPGQEQDDVDLQRAIDSGRDWIDWWTGRTFGTETATARTYPATAPDLVRVVDLRSTAPTVEVDEDEDRTFSLTLLPSQYSLHPLSGPPFGEVRMWAVPAGGAAAVVLLPDTLVRITGDWGYTDARGRIPAQVSQANLLLGARWFKRREAPFSVLQSVELDAFQRVPPRDDDVVLLLAGLCRPGSPGALLLAGQLGAGGVYGAEWVAV